MNTAPHFFFDAVMSPAQRWDAICKLVEEARRCTVVSAQAQTEAAEFIASEAHGAACDQLLMLILSPEAGRMLAEVKEFLDFSYGGQP